MTRTTAEETSGPMPSPGMSVIVCFILKANPEARLKNRIQESEFRTQNGKAETTSASLFFRILDSDSCGSASYQQVQVNEKSRAIGSEGNGRRHHRWRRRHRFSD